MHIRYILVAAVSFEKQSPLPVCGKGVTLLTTSAPSSGHFKTVQFSRLGNYFRAFMLHLT